MMQHLRLPFRFIILSAVVCALVAAVVLAHGPGVAAPHALTVSAPKHAPNVLQLERRYAARYPQRLLADRAQMARLPDGKLPNHLGTLLPTGSWSPLGPAPEVTLGGAHYAGPVTAIAVDPTTSGSTTVLYAGAYDGGIWKSSNNGQTWTALTDRQPDLFISAITIDPTNNNVVYAANALGILKSTDAGATWTATTSSLLGGGTRIIVNPHNPAQLWATGFGGLFTSTNGGTSWSLLSQLPNLGGSVDDVVMNPATNPVTLFAVIEQTGILRSTDGGNHWYTMTNGLPSVNNWDYGALAVAPSNTNVIYAVDETYNGVIYSPGSYNGGYYSTDNGTHWAQMASLNVNFTYGPINDLAYFSLRLQVDPQNDETLYGLGQDVAVTTNARGGSGNWQNITNATSAHPNSSIALYQYALAFPNCASAPCPIYVGNGGGIWYSNTSTATPGTHVTYAALNYGTLQIASLANGSVGANLSSTKFGIAPSEWNGTTRYLGNGAWGEVISGVAGETQTEPLAPQTTFLLRNGVLLHTDDSGGYWHSGGYIPGTVVGFAIDPANPQHLAATNGYAVYETRNNGQSWYQSSQYFSNGDITNISISPKNGAVLALTTLEGAVWRTANGNSGRSSTYVQAEPLAFPSNTQINLLYPVTFDPNDARGLVMYVASFNETSDGTYALQTLAKTANGGGNWANISGGIPNGAFAHSTVIFYAGATRVVVVGTYLGVFMTTNDGVSWAKLAAALPNSSVSSLVVDAAHTTLVAFLYGRGAWSVPLN